MFTDLFNNYISVLFWRVDFKVISQTSSGAASLVLKKNILPTNGLCSIDQTNGQSFLTVFNIKCLNWVDPDGAIAIYEYMGKLSSCLSNSEV